MTKYHMIFQGIKDAVELLNFLELSTCFFYALTIQVQKHLTAIRI